MSTALASTTGGVMALLVLRFVGRQQQFSFAKIEVLLLLTVPVFIGGLLVLRPKFLVGPLAPRT
jgi:hypothetical protein